MKFGLSLAYLALAPLAGVSGAWAGAWTQAEGQGQLITQVTAYESQGAFDDKGMPVGGRFERTEISAYVEYGLTDRWTIGAQPRLQTIASESGGKTFEGKGAGDFDLFLRRRVLARGPWAASVQALVKLDGFYSGSRVPAPGNGALEFEGRAAVGRSVGATRLGSGYANIEAGYRVRSEGLADQVRLDASAGWRIPRTKILAIAESLNTLSADSGANDYEVYKVQVTMVRPLWRRLSLQAGAMSEVGGARVGLGQAAIVGLWLEF